MRCGVGCGVGDWQLAVYQFIDIFRSYGRGSGILQYSLTLFEYSSSTIRAIGF